MQNFIEFLTTPWVYIYYTALIVLMLVYFYFKGRSERAKREAMEQAKAVYEKKMKFVGKGSEYIWAYVFKDNRFVGKIRFRRNGQIFLHIPISKIAKLVPEVRTTHRMQVNSGLINVKGKKSPVIEVRVIEAGRLAERQIIKEGDEVQLSEE